MSPASSRPRAARLVATFFGIGHVSLAPGTVATIAAIPLYLAAWYTGGHVAVMALAILLMMAGIAAAGSLESSLGYHDPPEVVIDEVAGFLTTMAFLTPGPLTVTGGFLLFRALDIIKPWPASAAEKLRGGWGIMADDIVCGLMANMLLQLGLYLWR